MKFTIVDTITRKPVKFSVRKPSRDSHLEVRNLDTDEAVVTIFSQGGKLGIRTLPAGPNVVVSEMHGGSAATSPAPGVAKKGTPKLDDGLRNWKIEDDVMIVTHPITGAEVELSVLEPGPRCPAEDVYEIIGQPGMLFSVAYALSKGSHSMLTGPTGTGKTTIYKWFAKKLGWNYVQMPIARGTESFHMIGDYMPVGPALFEWIDGPVTEAGRLSQDHPTLLVLDELNRIGNIAEFSEIYPLLDDSRRLTLRGKRNNDVTEVIEVGELAIGATANPSDDEHADYVGVQDLDPALSSRFTVHPEVRYPEVSIEVQALIGRVPDIDEDTAYKMCNAAKRIREAAEVRFPMSFRELVGWAQAYEMYGWLDAAEVTVVNKAPQAFRASIRNYLQLT